MLLATEVFNELLDLFTRIRRDPRGPKRRGERSGGKHDGLRSNIAGSLDFIAVNRVERASDEEFGDASKESTANPKSARQLRKDMHDSLRSAAIETGPPREVAIRRLLAVYIELARDTQFTEDDRLAALRLVRNRLQKISEELTKAARKTAANKSLTMPPAANKVASELEISQASDPIKGGLPMTGQSNAAPARGGMQSEDDGDSLVDLIQRTIATQTWDVNGGRGVIRYYAPDRRWWFVKPAMSTTTCWM